MLGDTLQTIHPRLMLRKRLQRQCHFFFSLSYFDKKWFQLWAIFLC
ncbi:Uncharacterised protein [Vibrio cholerae]|nr:Uncharacterised protein [Vibrio cholerae]